MGYSILGRYYEFMKVMANFTPLEINEIGKIIG